MCHTRGNLLAKARETGCLQGQHQVLQGRRGQQVSLPGPLDLVKMLYIRESRTEVFKGTLPGEGGFRTTVAALGLLRVPPEFPGRQSWDCWPAVSPTRGGRSSHAVFCPLCGRPEVSANRTREGGLSWRHTHLLLCSRVGLPSSTAQQRGIAFQH